MNVAGVNADGHREILVSTASPPRTGRLDGVPAGPRGPGALGSGAALVVCGVPPGLAHVSLPCHTVPNIGNLPQLLPTRAA